MAWYFYHSYKGRAEVSVMAMEAAFGHNTGYALVYKTLECMGELGGIIPKSQTSLLSIMLGIDQDELRRFVKIAIDVGFFIDLGDAYGNEQFMADYEKINNKSTKSREAALQRWRQKDTEPEPEIDLDIKIVRTPKTAVPYEQIIDCWNGLAVSMKCQKLTADLRKAIEKRVKDYGLEVVLQTVKNYHDAKNAPNTFFEYGWNMTDFFNRKNAFPAFVGDHDAIVKRYQKGQSKQQTEPEPERRGGMYTQQETDPASDNHYRSHPEMTDPRCGKKWGEMSKEEIDNMIKSRRYDENGKRIQK